MKIIKKGVCLILLLLFINTIYSQKNSKYSDTLYLKNGEKIVGREKAIFTFSFKDKQEIKFCKESKKCKKYKVEDIDSYNLNLKESLIKKRHKFLLNKGNEENVDPTKLVTIFFNGKYHFVNLIYRGKNRDFYKSFYYTIANGKQKIIVRLFVTKKGERTSFYSSRLDFGGYKNRLKRHSEFFTSSSILDTINNKAYKKWDSDIPIFKLLDESDYTSDKK